MPKVASAAFEQAPGQRIVVSNPMMTISRLSELGGAFTKFVVRVTLYVPGPENIWEGLAALELLLAPDAGSEKFQE